MAMELLIGDQHTIAILHRHSRFIVDVDVNHSGELFLILKSSFRAKGFDQSDEFIKT